MSRGGRGGFRGGRGGGPGGGSNMPPMGLSFGDLGAIDKTPSKLYPELTTIPKLSDPSEKEIRDADYLLKYLDEQRNSPYWPVEIEKKFKDVSRYTDKYRPEEQEPPSLKSVHMQKDVFPSEVWRAYMDGEIRREQIKAQKHAKRAKINWEGLDLEEKAGGELENPERASSDAEEEYAYEDEEDDDYAENYFDNGEDYDDDDGGGGGGDDGGGTYD